MKYDVSMRAGDRISCETRSGIRNGIYAKPMAPNVHTWCYVLLDGDEDYTPVARNKVVPLKGTLTNTEKFIAEYEALCAKYSMEIGGVESDSRLMVGGGDDVLYRNFDQTLDETVWTSECPEAY